MERRRAQAELHRAEASQEYRSAAHFRHEGLLEQLREEHREVEATARASHQKMEEAVSERLQEAVRIHKYEQEALQYRRALEAIEQTQAACNFTIALTEDKMVTMRAELAEGAQRLLGAHDEVQSQEAVTAKLRDELSESMQRATWDDGIGSESSSQ